LLDISLTTYTILIDFVLRVKYYFNMDQETQTISATTQPTPTRGTGTALLLDIREAAEFLGLTSWQVRGLVATEELRIVRVGRKFYFRKQALMRWAERAEQ